MQPISLWFEEIDSGQARKFLVKSTLYGAQSDFQRVDIIETTSLGRMLLLDGLVMCSEKDEFIYHEMIAHVPMFTHPDPQHVLIIGGGDGGTAREVLRHQGVKACTMVEIDGMVIDACRQHLQQTACDLDHPKLDLIVGDGVAFVAETQKKFDVIIVDSTDPVGMAAPLFGETFYRNVNRILNPNGLVVAQAESPNFHSDQQRAVVSRMHSLFEKNHIYNYFNLTYPGSTWSFALGSKGPCPRAHFNQERWRNSQMEMKYYNPEVHHASFALPQYQKRLLADCLSLFD